MADPIRFTKDNIDTYDFGSYGTNLKVDLQPGGWTTTSTTQLAYLGGGNHGWKDVSAPIIGLTGRQGRLGRL